MRIQPKFSNSASGKCFTTDPASKGLIAKAAIAGFKEHVPNVITGTPGTAVYFEDLDRMRESLGMVGHEVVCPY